MRAFGSPSTSTRALGLIGRLGAASLVCAWLGVGTAIADDSGAGAQDSTEVIVSPRLQPRQSPTTQSVPAGVGQQVAPDRGVTEVIESPRANRQAAPAPAPTVDDQTLSPPPAPAATPAPQLPATAPRPGEAPAPAAPEPNANDENGETAAHAPLPTLKQLTEAPHIRTHRTASEPRREHGRAPATASVPAPAAAATVATPAPASPAPAEAKAKTSNDAAPIGSDQAPQPASAASVPNMNATPEARADQPAQSAAPPASATAPNDAADADQVPAETGWLSSIATTIENNFGWIGGMSAGLGLLGLFLLVMVIGLIAAALRQRRDEYQ